MYRVYSIIELPKQEDFWLNIGVAFPHEKGDGFNIVLQALPLHGNGKLVMRAWEPRRQWKKVKSAQAAPLNSRSQGPRSAITSCEQLQ
jgi:hypothetical protein